MVTIKTVAKMAGVSPTTVSYALNNRPGVKDETVKKVMEAARKLNYVPNTLAQSFRNKKSNTILVSTFEALEDYGIFSQELMGTVLEARNLGYDVLIKSFTHSDEKYNEELFNTIAGKRADAMVLIGNGFDNLIQKLIGNNIKVVLLSSFSKYEVSSVNIDGAEWIFKITEFLIKKGYDKLAYMTYFTNTTEEEVHRVEGYRRAIKTYNVVGDDDVYVCGSDNLEVYNTIKNMLLHKRPRAIVCWNDALAMKVIDVCKEMNVRVPEDVAVTGFDDVIADLYQTPSLTTVKQPFFEMSRKAVRLLVDMMNSKIDSPVKLCVDCELIIRNSI